LFYLINYSTVGTGASYEPLPIAPITDQEAAPQAVLRPAK
jgi:hypothetical protein